MSKIFETVKKGEGEISDLIRTLVNPNAANAPAGAEANGARVRSAEPGNHGGSEAPSDAASLFAEVRTLKLRVPAPSPLLPYDDNHRRPSEQYRILRTKIGQHPKQPRVIAISSPASGDGKSVTAINTAAVLSLKSGSRVLLVDADLRKSAVHVQLGLPEAPGLADVLQGSCRIEEAMVRTQEFPNLFVLSCGTPLMNPVELLDSANWQALCARLRGLFRYVVLDCPPVGAVADYDLIQAASDGVILVVRPDHTNRQLCQKALETVPKPKLLGVLLNCVPDWSLARRAGSDYYYYSGKTYEPAAK